MLGSGRAPTRPRRIVHRGPQGDVSGQHHDSDAAAREGGLHGDLEQARHLLRLGDELAEWLHSRNRPLRVGLLEVSTPELLAGDLGGDRQHRHATAVTVVQPVDEVQVARAAAACAHPEPPGQVRLGAGGERGGLLVPHRDPLDVVARPDRVRDPVEGVAGQAVDPGDARRDERVDEQLRNGSCRHEALDLLGLPHRQRMKAVRSVFSFFGEPQARARG